MNTSVEEMIFYLDAEIAAGHHPDPETLTDSKVPVRKGRRGFLLARKVAVRDKL